MVSKTRDKLIEVARQLFVNKGVENTTMNDIAAASDKGRRTIYTYFKNKREIYNAVVESESNAIIGQLRAIVDAEMPPIEKLRKYLSTRFEIISNTLNKPKNHYDRYRSLFSRDARRVERIYEMARKKEQIVFMEMLRSGVEQGAFDRRQAERLLSVMSLVLMTTDHFAADSISSEEGDYEKICNDIIDFVTIGVTSDSL